MIRSGMRVFLASLGLPALSLLLSCGGPPSPSVASSPAPAPASATGSATGSATPSPPAVEDFAFVSLHAGGSGAMRGARAEAVIRSPEEWRAWRASLRLPQDALPSVDFERQVVLAVDGEDGTNGCHAVRITAVVPAPDGLRADVTRFVPGPEQRCAMVMTRPFHAVAVTLPAGARSGSLSVSFRWSTATGNPKP